MIQLRHSLAEWNSKQFDTTFVKEVSQLSLEQLPLQQAMTIGSTVVDDNRTITINSKHADETNIIVRTSVFFCSIIAGCSCADDPTPIDLNNEYCELEFIIDRQTADTQIVITG